MASLRHDPLIVGVLFTPAGEGMPATFVVGRGHKVGGAAEEWRKAGSSSFHFDRAQCQSSEWQRRFLAWPRTHPDLSL